MVNWQFGAKWDGHIYTKRCTADKFFQVQNLPVSVGLASIKMRVIWLSTSVEYRFVTAEDE